MEAEILAGRGSARRHADLGIDDQMANLMGDDVEVEAERQHLAGRGEAGTHLEEPIASGGIIEAVEQRDLERVVVAPKIPFDGPPEVTFPDIKRPAHAAIDVRRLEFRRSRLEVVKMARRARSRRR